MFPGDHFCPDSLIPFSTYRTPRADGTGFLRGGPELSATIAHFYFSERLRSVDQAARLDVLGLPSASEARKVVQRLDASEVWTKNRLGIVKAALWLQFLTVPSLATQLLDGSISIGDGGALGHGWESRRRGDERWKQVVLKTATQFQAGNNMALLATGDPDIYNPFLFSSRVAVLLGERVPTTVVVGCRAGVDAMAEDWALQRYIPAVHLPVRTNPGSSVPPAAITALSSAATHAIVFSKGEDATVRNVVATLTEQGKPTRIIHLDDHGRPLPKKTKPQHSRG